jgi:hypothetical protein
MSTETETMSNDIYSFEQDTNNTNNTNNTNKIAVIILVVKNYEVVNIFKNNIITQNNEVPRKELIGHLKSIELLKDCKIQYMLKFMMTKSLEELNFAINLEDSYKITPFTSLNNITFSKPPQTKYVTKSNKPFNKVNSLMLIVTKN